MRQLLLLVLMLANGAAFAQAPTRVRGTITGLEGDVLSVKARDGKEVKIHLTADAQVATAQKATMADFKPGSYVGVTSVKGPDGRLVARRVHQLGPQVPQMHGAWDSIPDSLMTNANIESMAQVSGGNELTLKYKDGEQKIMVPAGTPIVGFDNGDRSALKKGETIWTNARVEGDGKLVTNRVQVSKDGVKPEH
jgi:hypothetical protein